MNPRKAYLAKQLSQDIRRDLSISRKNGLANIGYDGGLHWHDYYEFELLIDGCGRHIFNGSEMPIQSGTVYLLSPKDFHALIESPEHPICLYTVNFNEKILPPKLLRRLSAADSGICLTLSADEMQQLMQLCERMLEEYRTEDENSGEMLNALLVQALIFLLRRAPLAKESVGVQNSRLGAVGEVVAFLRTHFREPIKLADCAKMVNLTPNYLGELFYRENGVRFQDYLRQLRFAYALDLLRVTDATVDIISYQAGFPSASYFAALFRREYQMSPTQYRAKLEKKTSV